MKKDKKDKFFRRLKALHLANRKKGVYDYMWLTGLKIILIYAAIVIPLVLIGKYFIDVTAIFNYFTELLPDTLIFILFIVSESTLGMIPPDIFVIWSAKFNNSFLLMTIFGLLSYGGGIVAYYIGRWLSGRKKIKRYTEEALNKYINLARKWGGAFIIIAALFPFSPFPLVVIALSLLKYPIKLYLIYGISRIFRYLAQGLLYLGLLNLDTILG